MDVKNEILKAIDIIIYKSLDNLKHTDIATVVTDINNNKYKVTIDGGEYWLKDGVGIHPKIGQVVWVHKPNGNINDAYISALR